MRTWTFTDTQIVDAAKLVSVNIYNLRDVNKSGSKRFQLHTNGVGSKYRRRSYRGDVARTIPGAVCWHGHRDFMRALFVVEINGRVQTAMADYRGRRDFEDSYRDVLDYSNEYRGNGYVDSYTACVCEED